MELFKRGYYKADINYGITYIGSDLMDEDNIESIGIMPLIDFLEGIDGMEDGDIQYTFIDNEYEWDILNEEYDIDA